MSYQQLIFDTEKEEIDLWDFENFDWLLGSPENLKIFFTKTISRLEKMIAKNPQTKQYKKLKADCMKRLKLLKKK